MKRYAFQNRGLDVVLQHDTKKLNIKHEAKIFLLRVRCQNLGSALNRSSSERIEDYGSKWLSVSRTERACAKVAMARESGKCLSPGEPIEI